MRISDWSSDVCSSDLAGHSEKTDRSASVRRAGRWRPTLRLSVSPPRPTRRMGRASRGCPPPFQQAPYGRRGHDLQRREDRKSVVSGKSVAVRVEYGGRRYIKKKTK